MALLAFAGNSVLCRLALQNHSIDSTSFTLVRLLSGAIALIIILSLKNRRVRSLRPNWMGALALFIYAWMFSLAYLRLDTATGALILFSCVQITMLGISILRGVRFSTLEWLGSAIAIGGFIWLMLPSASSPDPLGALLMGLSGVAWGIYSLKGATSSSPLSDTTSNFFYSLIWMALVSGILFSIQQSSNLSLDFSFVDEYRITTQGLMYALASGALTSGAGYAIWYAALANLPASVAAISQLSVPLIAALGGVIVVGESLSARLILSTFVILGGIGLVIFAKTRQAKSW